eukprot:1027591_1
MPVKTCVYVFMSIMCLLTSMTTTSQNSSGHTVITVPNVYDSGLNKHPATSYQSKMRYPILLNEDKMRLNGKGIDQAVTYQGYSNIAYTKQSVYLMLFAVCFLSAVFVSFVIRTDIKQAILLYLTTQSLMTPFVKAQPTPSPTYAAPVISSCGSYRSCYYLNIAPLPGVAVSRTIDVQGGWPWIFPVDSYFEIYVTPKGHPCVDPSISVAYEAIDYDDAEDTLSVNASGTIIATCGGSTPKACGTFESCLSGYNLGIAQIYGEQQAKLVTIQRSASVGADCSPLHDYAINVQLTITCSAQTGHPTASPTRLPSSPSSAPTEITTQPTQSPTYADPVISSCGTYRSCYYLNIAPMPDVNVTRTINVTGPDVPGYDSFFEIHLTAKGHPCTNPSVTVTYERIDYDNAGETFSVNASGTIIATCGGSTLNSCGAFASCLSGYNLPITQIESEEQTRLMTIKRESVVDAMCSHDYAINVRLTITCSAKTGHPTASPTRLPSLSPTNVPSTQSPTDVTSQPTLSPTYAAPVINSSCGSHRTCYYLNIAPIPGITISRTIDVQEIGGSYDSYFEIYVTPKGHSCTDPSITLTYERIDYDSPTETLSVNASGTEIATCGGSTSNLCDSFASCLSGYYLGITQLDSEQEAQLITIKRDSSVRYSTSCSHNYAVNVHLTITCSAKTGQPTVSPSQPPTRGTNAPTNAPSSPPTASPSHAPSQTPTRSPSTAPTMAPTVSPTMPSASPSHAPSQAPTRSPSTSPTMAPTTPSLQPTINPSGTPSVAPTMTPSLAPSVSPSQAPSISPSQAPSLSPSQVPSVSPSQAPSISPSQAPSVSPSFAPSKTPSTPPSNAPTKAPSNAPSNAPSTAPTYSPTKAPSIAPSNAPSKAPTHAPSNYPSDAPTLAPSYSPSRSPSSAPTYSPTRYPTKFDAYSKELIVTFSIYSSNASAVNMSRMASSEGIKRMIIILENAYVNVSGKFSALSIGEQLEYRAFEVLIDSEQIHIVTGTRNLTIAMSVQYAEETIGDSIRFISRQDMFRKEVSRGLMAAFSENSDSAFTFNVMGVSLVQPEESLEAFDYVFPLLASIMAISVLLAFGALAFNKYSAKIDDAVWTALVMFGLQVFDLGSDVNLCVEILLQFDSVFEASRSLLYISGYGSLFFIIVPYMTNIALASKMKSIVAGNSAAVSYFEQRSALFVSLVIFSGGVYPVLALMSSRIFALGMFDCGLTRYELMRLSKLKIFGSVVLENLPQMFIQLLYISYSGAPSHNTILSSVASFLSIIGACLSYCIQKTSGDCYVNQYDLQFRKAHSTSSSELEKKQIKASKECKGALRVALSSALDVIETQMELGFVNMTQTGFVIHIVHYTSKQQLDNFNDGRAPFYGGDENQLYHHLVASFTERLYAVKSDKVDQAFNAHFGFSKSRFEVKYHKHFGYNALLYKSTGNVLQLGLGQEDKHPEIELASSMANENDLKHVQSTLHSMVENISVALQSDQSNARDQLRDTLYKQFTEIDHIFGFLKAQQSLPVEEQDGTDIVYEDVQETADIAMDNDEHEAESEMASPDTDTVGELMVTKQTL